MSSIEFTLFAPTIAEAQLVGSFSEWKEIPMQLDNGTFRCSVPLADGTYQYKFRIRRKPEDQEWIDVVDPYVKVYDPDRNNGTITVENGKVILDNYQWQHDHVRLPENQDLIIYEMYIADFTEKGTFLGAIEKLDYLRDLGINCIELMPIQESMGKDHDWGYLTRHHFALKATYGTTRDLKELVDQCHRRQMRVFFDAVFNHTATDCPLQIIDHDYWYYHGKHHPEDPFYWGPELNYEYYDDKHKIKPACQFATDAVKYWVGEFHMDGIRFDAAKQLDNYDILRELDAAARSLRPNQPFYTVAEHVPETPTILKANGGPLDACWSSSFHGVIENNLLDQSKFELDWIEYVIREKDLINYLACHDNERLLFLIGKRAKWVDDEAYRCLRLAVILLMTSVGIPFICQGDEFGECREWRKEGNFKKKCPVLWNDLEKKLNRTLWDQHKALIALRLQRQELRENQVEFIHNDEKQRVVVYSRGNHIVIIAHFSPDETADYEIENFPSDSKWVDYLTKEEYQVENKKFKTTLKPFDARVLLLQQ